MESKTHESLPLVMDKNTKLLIVGTAPGIVSLEKKEYYSNESNRFWRIIFDILDEEVPLYYNDKINSLQKYKIGLWDVCHSFRREYSSLDSEINHTEVDYNDFKNLPNQIEYIIVNGKCSDKKVKIYKIVKEQLKDINQKVKYCSSTSSRNIARPQEEIKAEWKQALKDFKII